MTTVVSTTPGVPSPVNAPATAKSGVAFTVSWPASTNPAPTSYKVQKRKDLGTWQTYSVSASSTSKTFTETYGRYDFRVRACNGTSCSAYSAFDTTYVSPAAPGTPVVSGNETGIDRDGSYAVSWSAVANATSYQLQEKDFANASPAWTTVQQSSALSFSVANAQDPERRYRVRACANGACSAWSPQLSVSISRLSGVVASAVAITPADAVGSPGYSTSVSGAGNARISVPMEPVPGVNGLEPKLALVYSSGGARALMDAKREPGLLGYGWSLAGLSTISRCRVGIGGDVALDATDRLCLDGNPLVPVVGSYWADQTQYETELRSFNRVIQQGTGNTATFIVQTPDGGEITYGGTVEARPAAFDAGTGSNVVYAWSVTERKDAFGNTLTVSWAADPISGTNYPLSIDYAGARVAFEYIARTDSTTLTLNSNDLLLSSAIRSVALSRVSMSFAGTPVREYRLDNQYVTGSGGDYLRLEGVQLCGYDEAGVTASCLAPLTFGWQMTAGAPPEFVSNVTQLDDPDGASTLFEYAFLSGTGSHVLDYTDGNPFGPPINSPETTFLTTQRCAVKSLKRSDGLGGWRTTEYAYKGSPHYNVDGRGFVGFYETRVTEKGIPYSGGTFDRVTYTQRRLDFPFIGRIARSASFVGNYSASAEQLSEEERAWGSHDKPGSGTSATVNAYVERVQRRIFEGGVAVSGSVSTATRTWTASDDLADITTQTVIGEDISDQAAGFTPSVWGEIDTTRTVVGAAHTRTVKQYFEDNHYDPTDYRVGFVTRTEVTDAQPGKTPVTVTQTRTAWPGSTSPQLVTAFPGNSELELRTAVTYDGLGHPDVVELWGEDVPTLGTTAGAPLTKITTDIGTYLDSRYPSAVTNAKGQITSLGYDARFGAVDAATDPNGLLTSTQYDAFGRTTATVAPDGTTTSIAYDACGASCPAIGWSAGPIQRVTVSTDNAGTQVAPTRFVYFDALGRVVLEEVEAFNAGMGRQVVETHYDSAGRVTQRSLPYFSNAAPNPKPFVTFAYDVRGRVIDTARPDGGQTTTSFTPENVPAVGMVVHVDVTERITSQPIAGSGCSGMPSTICSLRSKRSTFDALGRLISTTDAFGAAEAVTMTYSYDVQNHLDIVTVAGQQVADLDYDVAGHRIRITDPSTGVTNFDVDALGRTLRSTDAKLQATTFVYDVLGRVTERRDGAGSASEVVNQWIWDAANAVGQLYRRTNNAGFDEFYTYDALARLSRIKTKLSVPGSPVSGTYLVDYAYANGRLDSITYPSNVTIQRKYTSAGYLNEIWHGSVQPLRQIYTVDAFGNVAWETRHGNISVNRSFDANSGRLVLIDTGGNANPDIQHLLYQWRSDGSLYSRQELRAFGSGDDTFEQMDYDALGRLTGVTTTLPGGTRVLNQSYDALGNLTSKTSSVPGDPETVNYGYSAPYRLTSATIDGVPTTFAYDANGNIVQYATGPGSDDTFIDYDGRNNATRITVGSTSDTPTPTARDEFYYGPDGSRYLGKASWDDGGIQRSTWTVYLGAFEAVYPGDDASTEYYRKIQATDAALIRIRKPVGQPEQAPAYEYLHRDHLGSVDAITDGSGTLLHRVSFDAFGARRAADWSRAIGLGDAEFDGIVADGARNTSRGYTDHEQLDRTGFVHMNGRIYDPRIGRFLQADPFVQSPSLSQSYNRYAYVLNDPLSRTDPSGFLCVSSGGSDDDSGGGCQLHSGPVAFPFPRVGIPGLDYGEGVFVRIDERALAAQVARMILGQVGAVGSPNRDDGGAAAPDDIGDEPAEPSVPPDGSAALAGGGLPPLVPCGSFGGPVYCPVLDPTDSEQVEAQIEAANAEAGVFIFAGTVLGGPAVCAVLSQDVLCVLGPGRGFVRVFKGLAKLLERGRAVERAADAGLIGQGLRNLRRIRSGRLKGILRGDTSLPGGTQGAKNLFRKLSGRNPEGDFDRAVLNDGREVVFRRTSRSGVSKIEVVDMKVGFLEKISFRD